LTSVNLALKIVKQEYSAFLRKNEDLSFHSTLSIYLPFLPTWWRQLGQNLLSSYWIDKS